MHEISELRQKQSLPLNSKILLTKRRIREWYEYYNGDVYISFSGGKDSTVLMHIAKELYNDIPIVFVDTGLEYPEVREFALKYADVKLTPKKTFKEVIEQFGYPVVSKEIAKKVANARKGGAYLKYFQNTNKSIFNVSKRWHKLLDAPFKVSDYCCTVMKKSPCHIYSHRTNRKAITGQQACESMVRTRKWLQDGCNMYDVKEPVCNPLAFWTEQDILKYIKDNEIEIASVYGDIVCEAGVYHTTKLKRTGCMFCMFGVHLEKSPNRFQQMKETHPYTYDYCINKLKLGEVLDYIGVKYD